MDTQKYSDMFNDPKWMSEALRAGNTGLWKIMIDPQTPDAPRMFANDTMLMLLGLDAHPAPEECYRHWFSHIDHGSVPKVRTTVERIIDSGQHGEVLYPWNHPRRGQIFVRCGGRRVPTDDGIIHLMGYHQDITELQAARQSLMKSLSELEQASRDVLTGMPIRRVFFDNAERELLNALLNGHDVSFLMVDVDHFKQVNDRYGHLVGDDVLRELGRRFRVSLRDVDLSGRFGGEEFIFLLPQTDLRGAVQAAERLREFCSATPVKSGTLRIPITVSIGVSHLSPEDLADRKDIEKIMESAIDAADKAMYKAKQSGRNCTFACVKSDVDPYFDFIPSRKVRRESSGER